MGGPGSDAALRLGLDALKEDRTAASHATDLRVRGCCRQLTLPWIPDTGYRTRFEVVVYLIADALSQL